ncbi:ERAD-associated protein, partial [Gonapodya sp. JEL0774]
AAGDRNGQETVEEVGGSDGLANREWSIGASWLNVTDGEQLVTRALEILHDVADEYDLDPEAYILSFASPSSASGSRKSSKANPGGVSPEAAAEIILRRTLNYFTGLEFGGLDRLPEPVYESDAFLVDPRALLPTFESGAGSTPPEYPSLGPLEDVVPTDSAAEKFQKAVRILEYGAWDMDSEAAAFAIAEINMFAAFAHPRNLTRALFYYTRCANRYGNATAQGIVGTMYAAGIGAPLDQAK